MASAAPAPSSVPTSTHTYVLDDLARAAGTLMDAGRQAELIGLLKQFGVNSLPELPQAQYRAFATALRGLGRRSDGTGKTGACAPQCVQRASVACLHAKRQAGGTVPGYEYVRLYGDGGEMHERGGVAVLVESMVFTEDKMEAIGIPAGTLPVGWWIGFKVLDPEVWEKVKDGTYTMFSVEGEAERVEVEK